MPVRVSAFVKQRAWSYGPGAGELICIQPADENPGPHFAPLETLGDQCGVAGLSMGLPADYELAIALGAAQVRVGSAIFGVKHYSV